MSLINKSFTFVECTDCHKMIKIEVGKDIEGIKCECAEVQKVEEKPKKRIVRKKVEDATETV